MTVKIAEFAKTQFGIDLTDAQLQHIAIVASGQKRTLAPAARRMGLTTANKVILAYLQDGLKAI